MVAQCAGVSTLGPGLMVISTSCVVGGLRKECMYEGRDAIDREMDKARVLIRKGRFIPGPDHFPLQAASFENYRYFMEQMRKVVMSTQPEA